MALGKLFNVSVFLWPQLQNIAHNGTDIRAVMNTDYNTEGKVIEF
jgi:hypothetical protein